MIQKEKSQPMAFANACVATDGVVLVGNPNNKNNVKGSCGVIEELGHDGFHADKSQYHLKLCTKFQLIY